MRKQATSRAAAILLLASVLLAPSSGRAAPDFTGLYYEQRPGAVLPLGSVFRDQTGAAAPLGQSIGGAPTIIAIGYFHCPALCGIVRADLMQALAAAGLRTPADYRLVALSIDPAETPADAAAAMQADLARFPAPGADRGWRFLTGDAAAIARVTTALGFHARYDPGLKQFIHPTGLVFATPAGRVSSYLLGLAYSPADLRAGIARARVGGLSRIVRPILLLCLHYDASTGRYTLAVTRLLQAVSLLFLAAVAATMLARRRRPA